MIGLLTPATYWWGIPPWLDLDPSSDTRGQTRRMSRSSTLDGGSIVNDSGFSHSDREMKLIVRNITRAMAAILEQIAAFPVCYLSLDHGLYSGQVKSYQFNGQTQAQLTFWVAEKLV